MYRGPYLYTVIAALLRQALKEKGWMQVQLARKAKVNRSQLSSALAAREKNGKFSREALIRLECALGLPYRMLTWPGGHR